MLGNTSIVQEPIGLRFLHLLNIHYITITQKNCKADICSYTNTYTIYVYKYIYNTYTIPIQYIYKHMYNIYAICIQTHAQYNIYKKNMY